LTRNEHADKEIEYLQRKLERTQSACDELLGMAARREVLLRAIAKLATRIAEAITSALAKE